MAGISSPAAMPPGGGARHDHRRATAGPALHVQRAARRGALDSRRPSGPHRGCFLVEPATVIRTSSVSASSPNCKARLTRRAPACFSVGQRLLRDAEELVFERGGSGQAHRRRAARGAPRPRANSERLQGGHEIAVLGACGRSAHGRRASPCSGRRARAPAPVRSRDLRCSMVCFTASRAYPIPAGSAPACRAARGPGRSLSTRPPGQPARGTAVCWRTSRRKAPPRRAHRPPRRPAPIASAALGASTTARSPRQDVPAERSGTCGMPAARPRATPIRSRARGCPVAASQLRPRGPAASPGRRTSASGAGAATRPQAQTIDEAPSMRSSSPSRLPSPRRPPRARLR